jgi:lipid-A-disaccharide synthase-like uncharacterized protein
MFLQWGAASLHGWRPLRPRKRGSAPRLATPSALQARQRSTAGDPFGFVPRPPVAAKNIQCDRLRMQSLLAILQLAAVEVNAWKIIGWTGNLIFGLRFVWQWIASERAKKSIIPPGFWEISLLGSMIYTSYFIFYRHDSVGIISNLLPLPLYARNVFLHWRHTKSRKKEEESSKEADSVVD